MIFFGIFEGIARVLFINDKDSADYLNSFFNDKQYLEYDSLLGIRLRKGVKVQEYSFNSKGFRGKEFFSQKRKGTYRIIAFGGSTTIGSNAGGDSYTYPALLETMLNLNIKHPSSKRFEVINAGVFAYNSWHHLLRCENELDSYQPDMYLVMIGLNDVVQASGMKLSDIKKMSYKNTNSFTKLVRKRETFFHQLSSFVNELYLYKYMVYWITHFRRKLINETGGVTLEKKVAAFKYKENLEKIIKRRLKKNIALVILNYPWIVTNYLDIDREQERIDMSIPKFNIQVYKKGREITKLFRNDRLS